MSDEPDDILLSYLDTDFAAAIGRAVSAWAILEHTINEMIWGLAELEKAPGACITSQLTTVTRRMDALISLARLQKISAPMIGRLNKFKQRASALAEKRNRVAHDPWFYGADSKGHYRLNVTAKATLDFAYKAITEDDIKKIEKEIVDLTDHFGDIRNQTMNELYTRWLKPKK